MFLRNMKSNLFFQSLVKSGIIVSAVGLCTFVVIFLVIGNKFEKSQEEDVLAITKLITNAIEAADTAASTYESLFGLRMYSVSKAIAGELAGRTIDSISVQDLEEIRDEWELKDISLFTRQGEDIVVAKSSDPREIGLSSKDWGYWFTAFQDLMSLTPVTVQEGLSKKNFWAGPLTKSVLYNEQFLYAYYYDGTTDYLINPYISASDVHAFVDLFGPNKVIKDMVKSSTDIVEVAVLNIEPYLNSSLPIIEHAIQSEVLYGNHTVTLEQDKTILSSLLKKKNQVTVKFKKGSRSYKKIYIPLTGNRAITIVLDQQQRDTILFHIFGVMLAVYCLAFVIVTFFVRRMTSQTVILMDRVHTLAYFDSLTALPNRNYFQEYFKTNVQQRDGERFALFMIDFDNFKNINDTLGHAVGDQFLVESSNRLQSNVPSDAFLSRLGGDEFILISPILVRLDARVIADNLLSSFREPFILQNNQLQVSMSIGISLYPDDGKNLDTLMKKADIALYREKNKSKNNYAFYNDDLN